VVDEADKGVGAELLDLQRDGRLVLLGHDAVPALAELAAPASLGVPADFRQAGIERNAVAELAAVPKRAAKRLVRRHACGRRYRVRTADRVAQLSTGHFLTIAWC